MELVKDRYAKLNLIQNGIEWHEAQIKTFNESDYYRKQERLQSAEILLAKTKLERLYNHKETALKALQKALSKEIEANHQKM